MAEQNLRERRDHRDLDGDDWTLLVEAFRDLEDRGGYEPFVDAHDVLFNTGIHSMYFLPWHRDFLNDFETALRKDGQYETALPYWNWEQVPVVPTQLNGLRVDWGLNPPNVNRIYGLTYDSARQKTDWLDFQDLMGGWPHGTVHARIGGVMGRARSPRDPFFWMHHGYIDKVWAGWQTDPNHPDPSNMDDTMPLSPNTSRLVRDTVSIGDLGYTYVEIGGMPMG